MKRIIAAALLCALTSGCMDWSAVFAKKPAEEKAADAAPPVAAPPAAAAPAGQAAAQVQGNTIGSEIAARVVDKKKALEERPQLFETKNSITASDPIFAPAQGLRAAGSKVEMIAFENTIQLHKAQYDKYPTYAEFMDYYKQAHVQLKGLKPWQVYAYDEETGTISLMEDPVEKERVEKEWEAKNRF